MSDAQRERELKFGVPDEWSMPELATLLPSGATLAVREVVLDSTYYDTAARDLLASGLTLRKRTGDEDTGWHLKLPDGDARIEIRVPLGGRGVPAEIRELTVALRRRAALRPLASLHTRRRVHELIDSDGELLAEVADDHVTSHTTVQGFAVTRSWREVEVERKGGTEKLLSRAAELLGKHGATDAVVGSKLLHALDTTGRPEADARRLSGLISGYLDEQFAALVRGDVGLRRDADVVHPTRVATRRYRSVLRVFRTVLDSSRAECLDGELRWYAAALGEVRDVQVLRRHLGTALDVLPDELVVGPVRDTIGGALDTDEAAAKQSLRQLLDSPRYAALLTELRAWRAQLPVVDDGPASGVDMYLERAGRTLDKRLRAAKRATDGDEAQHRARKAAKRVRYVAELARPALGGKAKRVAGRAEKLQKRLGDRQDNVMAAEFLLRLGAASEGDGFTLGVLYQRERDAG